MRPFGVTLSTQAVTQDILLSLASPFIKCVNSGTEHPLGKMSIVKYQNNSTTQDCDKHNRNKSEPMPWLTDLFHGDYLLIHSVSIWWVPAPGKLTILYEKKKNKAIIVFTLVAQMLKLELYRKVDNDTVISAINELKGFLINRGSFKCNVIKVLKYLLAL